MEKKKVTQDTLNEYMVKHGVKMVRLAEITRVNPDVITSCFKHRKDAHGVPRYFSTKMIALLNEALPQLAEELRRCLLTFDSERAETSSRGVKYDKGLVESMKQLGLYLNITALCERVLGWKKQKKNAVFNSANVKLYGHITEADAIAINEEVLAIAGVLERYEVVTEE